MTGAERPAVRVSDSSRRRGTPSDDLAPESLAEGGQGGGPGADVLGSAPSRGRGRRLGLTVAAGVLAVAALVVQQHQTGPRMTLGPATLLADGTLPGDGTLAVVLTNRGSAVRVTGVELRADGLAVTSPGALDQEVAAAEDRGVPVAHDAARVLARGRHTLEIGVRAGCPGGPVGPAQVLVQVETGGARRTLAGTVPGDQLGRLHCQPLSVHAGLAPTDPAPGEVALLLIAHAGQALGAPGFQRLAWTGYHVSAVGGVVPLALGWAAADANVVFSAVVTPDCTASPAGGLAAVFATGPLVVPVTGAAAARVRALRAACR